jgi:hypothetical protein
MTRTPLVTKKTSLGTVKGKTKRVQSKVVVPGVAGSLSKEQEEALLADGPITVSGGVFVNSALSRPSQKQLNDFMPKFSRESISSLRQSTAKKTPAPASAVSGKLAAQPAPPPAPAPQPVAVKSPEVSVQVQSGPQQAAERQEAPPPSDHESDMEVVEADEQEDPKLAKKLRKKAKAKAAKAAKAEAARAANAEAAKVAKAEAAKAAKLAKKKAKSAKRKRSDSPSGASLQSASKASGVPTEKRARHALMSGCAPSQAFNIKLKADLLAKVVTPEIGTSIRSDPGDFRAIERQVPGTILTGNVISASCYNNVNLSVHLKQEVPVGIYAIVDGTGTPFAHASVTSAEGCPSSYQQPIWHQWNPYGYPLVSKLLNLRCSAVEHAFILCISKRIGAGDFGVVPLPYRKANPVYELSVRDQDLDFGLPQNVKFR